MDDIDEILRRNPKAAKGLEAVKATLEELARLRAIGVAKGDQNTIVGRGAVGCFPPSRDRLRPKI